MTETTFASPYDASDANPWIAIPEPVMLPFGIPVNASGVKMVWDAFVKPGQDAGTPQSVEDRLLMAILRAVNHGLELREAVQSEVDTEGI